MILEGKRSLKGTVVTSYGPSGTRGESGRDIYGCAPSDPRIPVTHEKILNGMDKPKGKYPPATQIR